jgi:hypothetical protein
MMEQYEGLISLLTQLMTLGVAIFTLIRACQARHEIRRIRLDINGPLHTLLKLSGELEFKRGQQHERAEQEAAWQAKWPKHYAQEKPMSIITRLRDIIFAHWRERQEERKISRAEYAQEFLTAKAAGKAEPLDWRHSVEDLLKVLDEPSGLEARQALARELGWESAYTGTAEQNLWLHQQMMDAVAAGEYEP